MATGLLVIGEYESYPLTQHGKIVIGYYGANPPVRCGKLIIGTWGGKTPYIFVGKRLLAVCDSEVYYLQN